jgi:hypothetical protein
MYVLYFVPKRRRSIVAALRIAVMDNKKVLASCSLSMPVNIPVATVASLLDMLEKYWDTLPYSDQYSIIDSSFLWPTFSKAVIRTNALATMKLMPIENGS